MVQAGAAATVEGRSPERLSSARLRRPRAAPVAGRMIQAGQRYKLSGLAAAHLNGKTCKIRRYDEEKKRWIVDLDADLEKNHDAPKALRAR